jgi:hypothetical protein
MQDFQKCVNHLKILGIRMVTWSKFYTYDSQMLLSNELTTGILI